MSFFNDAAPLDAPEIQKLLPDGYTIEFVRNSSGWLTGMRWEVLPPDVDCTNSRAIQIRAANRKIVAAFGWWIKGNRRIITTGTWVSDKLRRRGIGRALWREMAEQIRPKVVESHTITRAGLALAKTMRGEFRDRGIKVMIYDSSWVDDTPERPMYPARKGSAA